MKTPQTPPILELGSDFYDPVLAADFPEGIQRYRNQLAAEKLGLGSLSNEEWKEHFWRFLPLPGNLPQPLALRYHGHQFQHYNPDLGDGRGFLFAQIKTATTWLDLGTKGSGQTPYSRRGDGRLTLKGAFREILATELLESLGVNTSKTFSVFETGEALDRNDEPSPTRGAVLVRLSHSHIRYGTFQRLAYFKDSANILKLLNYCVEIYYPHLKDYAPLEKATLFLQAVCTEAAKTAAQWMIAGFVHGVLNSDNMNITGESFDYGPYRFLPFYDPQFTAAYFDHQGLYCYGRQPTAVLWNLHQLGISLKIACPDLDYESTLEIYGDQFSISLQSTLLKRLNLKNPHDESSLTEALNNQLISSLFRFLSLNKIPFEQCLFDLHSKAIPARLQNSPLASYYNGEEFKALQHALSHFEILDEKKMEHPYFLEKHACSLLIDEIESLWDPIAKNDDWGPFEEKLKAIRAMRGFY